MSEEQNKLEKIKCGIIMPISAIDGCSEEHWSEVQGILIEAAASVKNYDFTTMMVSEAEDIGIIKKRIVQNVYNSDIVICDVSGKNPNVMFELGMRLAFDKPTIIVKDDKTNYSFDTGIIEYLEYPRDLRFTKIVDFKKRLNSKLVATLEESRANPEHATFLKSFGQFKVSALSEHEVTPDKAILESIEDLRNELFQITKYTMRKMPQKNHFPQEAIMKTKKVIDDSYKELAVTTLDELVTQIDLYERILDKINARRYFPTEEEFKDFYDYMLSIYNKKTVDKLSGTII
ncbi:hypothetical protein [Clostridium magnum]|uniref:RNA helicase n=1 Tax=Clostridium magnum DSM 2767 TaxID=1121326 RepID=A0A162UE44_9CLOT|nr:hypothetical protein [Clostridium magnum]KZL93801.1 hypothetical protein CLMAG_08520 [Clostridium magnum DSM 2767]SHI08672.1 hypothetical protein SAMN02745944_02396 [Clostridium magnum DSM 2767]